MTTIVILPKNPNSPNTSYRAIAGNEQSIDETAGVASDALVVRERSRPDGSFTTEQQRRLEELMGRWWQARDSGLTLPPEEQAELEALAQAELRAAAARETDW